MKKLGLTITVLLIAIPTYLLLANTSTTDKFQTPTFPNEKTTQQGNYGAEFVVAKNLRIPWAIAFLPSGDLLLTQREGQILFIDRGFDSRPEKIADISSVKAVGEGGLMGITTNHNFNQNHYVYLYYTYSASTDETLNRVSKFIFEGQSLKNEKVIVDKIPGATNHNGGRIKFGPDGFLYIGTGDAQNPSLAQNKNSLAGKILKVTNEGKPAPGNPFNNEVYSYGHRNVQGLSWDDQGNLWATEHGSSANDELNKIERGGNYGWPQITGSQTRNGIISPIINSGSDTWAPSGLAFYKGSFYFVGLKGASLFKYDPGSSSLSKFFEEKYGRIREAVAGPGGALYIITNNTDGRGSPKSEDDKLIRLSL